jgi:hypothetical protein
MWEEGMVGRRTLLEAASREREGKRGGSVAAHPVLTHLVLLVADLLQQQRQQGGTAQGQEEG